MTIKLFDNDPYLADCTATVFDCVACKEGFKLYLNQTIFYPQGGGQPADKGTINGLALLDVYEDKTGLVHLLESPIEIGQTVNCVLDFDFRLDAMQQHLGQHIFSRIAQDTFGAITTAARIEPNVSHVEFDRPLTRAEAYLLECKVGEVIAQNLPVSTHVYTREEAKELGLPPKAFTHEQIRTVTIAGLDLNPCGGTHPRTTGEVLGCVITGTKEVRGCYRIYYKFGGRAVADRQESLCYNLDLQDALGVTDKTEVLPQVCKLQEKTAYQQNEISKLKAEAEEIHYQLMLAKAESVGNFLLYAAHVEELNHMKPAVDRLVLEHEAVVLLTNRTGDSLNIVISQSKSVNAVNAGDFVRRVLAQYPGKGGGGPKAAQCTIAYDHNAHEAIKTMAKETVAALKQA